MKNNVLGLDIGEKRIGVAYMNSATKLPQPLTTLNNDSSLIMKLQDILKEYEVGQIVVGYPLNMSTQPTAQTKWVEDFANHLKEQLMTEIVFQDEVLSSHNAEEELRARNKPYAKADIDALAAAYILEDYVKAHEEVA